MGENYARYACPYADDSEVGLLESILTGVYIDSLTTTYEGIRWMAWRRTSVEVFCFFPPFPICFLSHSPLYVGRRRTSGPNELLRTQELRGRLHSFSVKTVVHSSVE